jgi:ubiquinone/menaquinone biosynthesis C-methylase UbiE
MDIREKVRDYYAARLITGQACCGPTVPNDLAVPSFGCGEPLKFADLRPGETVLDLGSGAGLDVFRAAEAVGPKGRVIGVDMTPEMLEKAREGAVRLSLQNVEFREGYSEALPVSDASLDVVISNCVINLSSDKAKVFSEAFRVLKPGRRLLVSDILRFGERLEVVNEQGWCACEDGAESAEVYRRLLKRAGFVDITVTPEAPAVFSGDTYSALIRARKANVGRAHEEGLG